ncbi:MAG: protein kinase [Deltaproteobacteria bacterium]|nr:protein kinase [Deltaproteobacteria bacterium]
MNTSPAPDLPAALARRFEARGVLGRGGMSVVYRAFDRLHAREVALKVTAPGQVEEGARLRDETVLLAELDHAGVVKLFGGGRLPGGGGWLASEVVEGARLDDRLAGPAVDAAEAAALVADLLETLGWLHGRGLVHADLKPANVLVKEVDGRPWPVLIDFGLARVAGRDEQLAGGTRTYLAPELRRQGARPTPASDLFALGVALRAVTSRFPALAALAERLAAPDPADRPARAAPRRPRS